ncbi:MAG: metallophosphoesterase family protein [bacterium]|nr:metallophosphoesterase family protein [bacterium]
MKIGIFSDIHGNIFSFEKIYKQLKKERCDMHLFLGDICGYYYYQNEVINILSDIPHLHSLAGNHDVLFLEALEDEAAMNKNIETYGRSFLHLKETILPGSLDYLRALSTCFHLRSGGIAAYHGSPWDPFYEYVYPASSMERFDKLPYKIVFLGHTHHVMDIRREGLRIVNPGSAGQPRDGGWPSYAVYDTETGDVNIKHVPYNVDAMIKDVKERDNGNPYLVEVLERIQR